MPRRQYLPAWVRRNIHVTDGPQAGRRVVLEPWQRQILTAIDTERKTHFVLRCASQIGKTLIALPVALRAALSSRGAMLASATGDSVIDLQRRLDVMLRAAPHLAEPFLPVGSGRGRRSSAALRETTAGGWLALASAGSASQLSSRTVQVAVCDEVARWPRRVRTSMEAAPLALLEARQQDWGEDAVLIALSSPVQRGDAIDLLWRDGDRRVLDYRCGACGERTAFGWDQVTGRELGEQPGIACAVCGAVHDERARRRMLRSGQWRATREHPTDPDVASFGASRLDSARSSLDQVVKAWRRARLRVERGDPNGLRAWRNLALGLPGESGAADVDKLYELRGDRGPAVEVEQVTAGVDVQADRLVYVVLGFSAGNVGAAVLDYGVINGAPDEAEPWSALASTLAQPFARLAVTCVSVDAGFHTSAVRRECQQRRWWLPVVGRAGEGRPLARPMGSTGICTMGADDASAWWAGRIAAGRVRLPADIDRPTIRELCASEALTAEGGALRWRPVESSHPRNHLWDCAKLAIHARHFRPLARRQRPFRLLRVG